MLEWPGRRLRAVQSSWYAIDAAALILRVALGVIFVAHGGQKLFGGFGGSGIGGTTAFFRTVGIPSPHGFAFVVGVTEFLGSVFLFAGFLTVVATIGLIMDMAVAIARVRHAFGSFSQAKVVTAGS